jgi:hypothetical protein
MRAVGSSGAVFVGDVRSLALLRALHAGIELARGDGLAAGELRERLVRRRAQEQELVLDPGFFVGLAAELEACGGVAAQVKRGWRHNELTRFRYDVVLHGAQAARHADVRAELAWAGLGDVAALRRALEQASGALLLRGVPSARLAGEEPFLERLERAEAAVAVQDLRQPRDVPGGVEPEALWALGPECGFDIQVGFAQASPYAYDVLCVPRHGGAAPTLWSVPPRRQAQPLRALANTLTEQRARHDLAEALRRHLRAKLPDYMIPASFIWLDAIPLTPHGKLNHRALPQPSQERASGNAIYAAPETPLHEQIVGVWKTVLGIDGFGIDANFFNIGGHSLMATQVVSRLSDLLDTEIPLRLMFEQPTIRGLADAATTLLQGGGRRAIPPVLPVRDGPGDAIDLEGLTDEEVEHLLMSLAARGGTEPLSRRT